MSTQAGTVEDTICQLLAAELCCRPDTIATDAEFAALPGLDSIKLLRVVSELERRYDVGLDDDKLYELRAVTDLADLVHTELRERMHLVSDGHGQPA
jgi:acyl carrier protein